MAEPSGINSRLKNGGPSSAIADAANEMQIDGSEVDAILSKSELLTREEVLRRRSRRMKQLETIYKDYYWALMEDAKQKHRNFIWEHGVSPFEGEEENRGRAKPIPAGGEENQANNGKSGLVSGASGNFNQCEIHGCKMKPMALTKYCHTHILSDTNQKLYKGCGYVLKSSPTAIRCSKPILRSSVPGLCDVHLEKVEKHARVALKKAGLNVVNSTGKLLAPKFHVLVAEYVNQIQSKRRATRKANIDDAESQKILKTLEPR